MISTKAFHQSVFSRRNVVNVQCRFMGTGTRGSRGHGWLTNYREGKGGRHLQGEYHDRNVDDMIRWNDAIFAMGSEKVQLDIAVERKSVNIFDNTAKSASPMRNVEELTAAPQRLEIEIASTVMPQTCENFRQLLQHDKYTGCKIYRFQPNVGLCGGDVLTNTGKTGLAHNGMLSMECSDPLPLWHVPGTVTMLVRKVGSIDSRFIFCTQQAPHLDGYYRAFARLSAESLAVVQGWQKTILTSGGIPTSYELIITNGEVEKQDLAA